MKKRRSFLSVLLMLATTAVTLGLAACVDKHDDEEQEPDVPVVPTGNKFTVPATGGTVETGTLKMEIPEGTFGEEEAVYVDKAGNVQEVKDVAASDFYKLTIPATTQQPIRVSVRSQQATDDCLMMVRSAGRAFSGGEQQDFCVPIEKVASSGDTFTAELPTLQGGNGMAEVTVGLITTESAKAATRTGDTYSEITVMLPYANRSIKVEVTSQTLYYDVAKTRILREEFIPQALHKLDSIGFRLDADRKTIPIEIVAYWTNEKRTGLWGQHICSKLTKHWDCVQINGEKLVNMTTQAQQEELAKTLVHELGHYFQVDYDKRRSQWSKATESPGAYYAFMEASSVWTEHYFGAPLSSIVVDNGKDFLTQGLWNCDASSYDTHGYGMAVLFTYLAKLHGDLSLISIFNDYKAGKDADVCLTDYAKAHNFRIDDIEWYNDFLRATAEGSVIDKYDMGGLTDDSWKVYDETIHPHTTTINRYGMAVRSIYVLEGTNVEGKQINLSEDEEGTFTEVYRADYQFSREEGVLSTVSNISYLGRVDKRSPLTVTDSLKTLFNKQRLFFVTLQDPQQSHQISVPSILTYQLTDPQPTLSVSATDIGFDHEGGDYIATMTTNVPHPDISTNGAGWLSADYDAALHQLTVHATKNTGSEQREATITIRVSNAVGSLQQDIAVTQSGKPHAPEIPKTVSRVKFNKMGMKCIIPVDNYYVMGDNGYRNKIGAIEFEFEADSTHITSNVRTPDGEKDNYLNNHHIYTIFMNGETNGIRYNMEGKLLYDADNVRFTRQGITGHISYGPAEDDQLTYSFGFTLPPSDTQFMYYDIIGYPGIGWSKTQNRWPQETPGWNTDHIYGFTASYHNPRTDVTEDLPIANSTQYWAIYPYTLYVRVEGKWVDVAVDEEGNTIDDGHSIDDGHPIAAPWKRRR